MNEPAADIVVGVGWSSEATEQDLRAAVDDTLAAAGVDRRRIRCVATLERERAATIAGALAWPVRTYSAEQLAGVDAPNRSTLVDQATGTPSVAEAAALLAAGDGASLLVPKRRSARVTVALAAAAPGGRSAAGRT